MSKFSVLYVFELKLRSDILFTLCVVKKCGNIILSK